MLCWQGMRVPGRSVFLLTFLILSSACSPATMGMNRMAAALSDTASAYARDDDPELVRVGAPSTLKMVEMMLETTPSHPGLLMTACSGFAQYAYAFLQVDGEMIASKDAASARELRQRAAKMYGRARGYCLRAIDVRHPGLGDLLLRDPKKALPALESTAKADVPALFWAASAWAGDLSVADNQLLRIPEIAIVRALITRAVTLDESWGEGAIHEVMIALEGLPAIVGGSAVRARKHFERAVALSGGQSAFAYVTMASSVAVPARDRREFESLLKDALAIDVSKKPSIRLANLIAQKRARFLLANAGTLFR